MKQKKTQKASRANASDAKLWFRAKRYGWGWTPCSWEGWLITLVFIVVLFLWSYMIFHSTLASSAQIALHLLFIVLWAGLLIFIAYKKGETPRWRWGD